MRVAKILELARTDFLDDAEEPYKWSESTLLALFNEAERQAARRAKLLLEKTNATATDVASGAATSTTEDKLVDSAAAFTTAMVGLTVYNTTDDTFTTISARDNATTLSLADDIMASGDAYIIGTRSRALTRVCVVSGTAIYSISNKVIKIDKCYLASDGLTLLQKTEAWLDDNYYNWRLATGTPKYYIEGKGEIQLVPKPDDNLNSGTGKDTLRMTVYRLPLTDMVATGDAEPEISEEYHFGLIDGACELAYLKQDTDTYDLTKSRKHADEFSRKFGPPVSALAENNVRAVGSNFKLNGPRW